MMNDKHIQNLLRIKKLLQTLEDYKSQMLEKGSWLRFGDWLDKPENKKFKGIKRASIEAARDISRRIIKDVNDGAKLDQPKRRILSDPEKYEQKADMFKEGVQAYLAEFMATDPFASQTWYIYIFHLETREDEPALGRAVLKANSRRDIQIKNLKPAYKDYEGRYTIIHNQASSLELVEKTSKDRGLHIKVYYSLPRKDEILLGSYITYQTDNHIATGSLVMARAPEDATPAILSYKDPDFKPTHENVIRYLSSKHNYHRIPRGIHTYKDLGKFLDNHLENWKSRFIEETTPQLFIASPGLSAVAFEENKKYINKIISELKDKFSGDIEIHNIHNQNAKIDFQTTSLKQLKKSRFFVLIYTETTKGSYALVQLGWALAHCKVVMIFYQQGSISDHIFNVPQQVAVVQSFTNLKNGFKNIRNTIEFQIQRNGI